jgi:hypothetical protein
MATDKVPITAGAGTNVATFSISEDAVTKEVQRMAIAPTPETGSTSTPTATRVDSAASTNATNLKASAGQIYEIDLFNVAAYDVFVKFYNKASAPTVGSDTPVWTLPLKSGTGYCREFLAGRPFTTGVSYAITKLQADSDTTAVALHDVTGAICWI